MEEAKPAQTSEPREAGEDKKNTATEQPTAERRERSAKRATAGKEDAPPAQGTTRAPAAPAATRREPGKPAQNTDKRSAADWARTAATTSRSAPRAQPTRREKPRAREAETTRETSGAKEADNEREPPNTTNMVFLQKKHFAFIIGFLSSTFGKQAWGRHPP